MHYSEMERELTGSPLKNTTNAGSYASKVDSPLRSQGSNSKTRNLVKSGSMRSKGSLPGFSPSPTKKQAENMNSHRSND